MNSMGLQHRGALLLLGAVSCAVFASCWELKIEEVSVVDGPEAGRLTVRLDLGLEVVEGEDQPRAASYNELGFLAVAAPVEVGVIAARLKGSTKLVGASGVRPMGPAPQVVRTFEREFVASEGVSWSAFHVLVDEVDPRVRQELAIEVDLEGVQPGETTLLLVPGAMHTYSTDLEPSRLCRITLIVGEGKALVRVENGEVTR